MGFRGPTPAHLEWCSQCHTPCPTATLAGNLCQTTPAPALAHSHGVYPVKWLTKGVLRSSSVQVNQAIASCACAMHSLSVRLHTRSSQDSSVWAQGGHLVLCLLVLVLFGTTTITKGNHNIGWHHKCGWEATYKDHNMLSQHTLTKSRFGPRWNPRASRCPDISFSWSTFFLATFTSLEPLHVV